MERRPSIATSSRSTRIHTRVYNNYTYIYEFRRGREVINEKLPTVFLRHSRIDLNICSIISLICKVYKLCIV